MSDPTVVTGEGGAPDVGPARVAGRYTLRGLLGVGGFGAVYRAIDELTGEEVAVKLVRGLDAPSRNRLRRELAALRWLQMPGVVTLRDDGPTEIGWFIVMDIVDGEPFPAGRTTWDALAETVRALFETLARVHAAGVVHRDLKPSNVLVRPDGTPVLLDFGVARGAAVSRPLREGGELTPGWAAPEVVRGEAGDARSDLWSAGRMVGHALNEAAPPRVAALLGRLLAPEANDRPRDASEVVDVLATLDRSEATVEPPGAPLSVDALAALFVGPEPFQHLASDPAAILHARTGGEPGAVRAELDRWRRAGLARRVGARWSVDRVGVDRLSGDGGVLPGEWRVGRGVDELVAAARAEARWRLTSGRPSSALAALAVGLAAARADGRGEGALLSDWVAAALAHESPGALDRALYELDRAESRVDPRLVALVRGGRSAYRGETDRALVDLDVAVGLPEELEAWRQGLRVRALARRGVAAEAAAIDALVAWAGEDRERQDRVDAWRGNLAYRQGDYALAARLHLSCVERRSRPDRRLAARLNAAYALLDALDLAPCAAQAETAIGEARALRHAVYEGYATWVARAVSYRLDSAGEPRPDLVEAAAPLRVHLLAQLALNEAAVAWRRGGSVAGDLALRARAAFESIGQREPARLCGALAVAAGVPATTVGGVDALAVEAPWAVPDLGLQTLGLLAKAGHHRPEWPARVRAWAATRPETEHGVRLDVASADECLAAVDHQP